MRPEPVVTSEAVPLELATAGIGSRFVALLVDWTIQAALAAGLVLGGSAASLLDATASRALFTVLLLVVVFGYPAGFETLWRGRTPGKAALGLRVVTVEGGPVRFRHAALRAALGLVDFALSLGSVAIVAAFASARNQRLGDLVAGTIVLRERSGLRPPAPADFRPPAALADYAESLDTGSLHPDDYAAVRAYLLRSSSLAPVPSAELARRLANALVERVRPAPPEGCSPIEFLGAVASAYQRRHRPGARSTASTASPAPEPARPDAPPRPPPGPPPGPAPEPGPPATGRGAQPPPAPPGGGFAPMD